MKTSAIRVISYTIVLITFVLGIFLLENLENSDNDSSIKLSKVRHFYKTMNVTSDRPSSLPAFDKNPAVPTELTPNAEDDYISDLVSDPTDEPTPEPSEEIIEEPIPLEGKDLYIFYIAEIINEYYPNVDPYIALAVLETESRYQPNVVSSAGAVGLMQLLPQYHAWRMDKYGLTDLFDPYTNIICGIDLLNDLYAQKGSWEAALYGYNASTAYVNGVLQKADILREDGYFA